LDSIWIRENQEKIGHVKKIKQININYKKSIKGQGDRFIVLLGHRDRFVVRK